MSSPLTGITILDLTCNLPGPYCSRLLSDLGARVIKVESPQGDPARISKELFNHLNFNKESICLNLKEDSQKEALYQFLPKVDVFLEGFRPGVCEELGFGYERVCEYRPDIIYCRISGYGQDGPYQQYPAHDLNLESLTGFCQLPGEAGNSGQECPLPIADFTSSLFALSAINAALYQRSIEKKGAYIDISMAEGLFNITSLWHKTIAKPEMIEAEISRYWNKNPNWKKRLLQKSWKILKKTKWIKPFYSWGLLQLLPHYGLFPTADKKKLCIGIVFEDHFWKLFCELLGGKFLKWSHLKVTQRVLKSSQIRKQIKKGIAKKTLAEWLAFFPPEKLPINGVNTMEEAYQDPHYLARKMIIQVENEIGARSPLLLSSQTESFEVPTLGQHNKSFYEELKKRS